MSVTRSTIGTFLPRVVDKQLVANEIALAKLIKEEPR
jgi:hypothetical protein